MNGQPSRLRRHSPRAGGVSLQWRFAGAPPRADWTPANESPVGATATDERGSDNLPRDDNAVPRARPARSVAIAACFWSIPALLVSSIAFLERSEREGTPALGPLTAFIAFGLPWYFWALATPVIFQLTERFPIDRAPRLRGIAAHVGAALACGAVQGAVNLAAPLLAGTRTAPASVMDALMQSLFWIPFGLLFYGATASVGFALDYHHKLRERELQASRVQAQLVEARLGTLRMQLQPHFLFNTLNTVSMLVRQGESQKAIRMLARLSELLRQILEDGGAQEVPIEEELDLFARYLEIEQVRFGDRLSVGVRLDEDARGGLVPNFLLQPLAENAIRHGIAKRAAAGRIELHGWREGGSLSILLRNDGPPLPGGWALDGAGIGLRNTLARLRHLYGDHASLRVDDAAEGGVEVRIALPWHTRPLLVEEAVRA